MNRRCSCCWSACCHRQQNHHASVFPHHPTRHQKTPNNAEKKIRRQPTREPKTWGRVMLSHVCHIIIIHTYIHHAIIHEARTKKTLYERPTTPQHAAAVHKPYAIIITTRAKQTLEGKQPPSWWHHRKGRGGATCSPVPPATYDCYTPLILPCGIYRFRIPPPPNALSYRCPTVPPARQAASSRVLVAAPLRPEHTHSVPTHHEIKDKTSVPPKKTNKRRNKKNALLPVLIITPPVCCRCRGPPNNKLATDATNSHDLFFFQFPRLLTCNKPNTIKTLIFPYPQAILSISIHLYVHTRLSRILILHPSPRKPLPTVVVLQTTMLPPRTSPPSLPPSLSLSAASTFVFQCRLLLTTTAGGFR